MKSDALFRSLIPGLIPGLIPLSSATLLCRPEGPVVPRPTALASSPSFTSAASNLSQALDAALAGTITAGWPIENVSFSLAVVSADQNDPGAPVWEYHHLAEANTRGTMKADRDSQYLIGSVTKVLTDYILLTSGVDADRPVTDFLPKLADGKSMIDWEEISLRMLGSYLAGVPSNYGFAEYYYLKDVFLASGFPPIKDSDYPPCGVLALNEDCSPDEFLQGMLQATPVTTPNERPAYSSVAFDILILALEEATGKNYTMMVDEIISKPLGMENTYPSPGDDKKAVIPPGDSSWGADYGYEAPGGGLVSSLSDLSRFTHALLTQTLALTPSQNRAWLKPSSFAGGLHASSGASWEIYRAADLTPAHPHAVTLYSKGGGAMAYRSQLSVVDEYGVGLVMLTAGPMHALTTIADAVIATFIPAVDKVAREQAGEMYARTFTGREGNTTVSARLKQDDDSLVLSSLERDGKDILGGITQIWNLTLGTYVAPISPTIRAFPSELTSNATLHGKPVTKQAWRLWPELETDAGSELPSAGVAAKDCVAWTIGDWVYYGGEALDRIEFYMGEDGSVVGMEVPFLRSGVLRPV